MYKKNKPASAVCRICGKSIEFIKNGNGNYVPVDPGKTFFVPDDFGNVLFVTSDGAVRKGRRAVDGLEGNTLHKPHCGRR